MLLLVCLQRFDFDLHSHVLVPATGAEGLELEDGTNTSLVCLPSAR